MTRAVILSIVLEVVLVCLFYMFECFCPFSSMTCIGSKDDREIFWERQVEGYSFRTSLFDVLLVTGGRAALLVPKLLYSPRWLLSTVLLSATSSLGFVCFKVMVFDFGQWSVFGPLCVASALVLPIVQVVTALSAYHHGERAADEEKQIFVNNPLQNPRRRGATAPWRKSARRALVFPNPAEPSLPPSPMLNLPGSTGSINRGLPPPNEKAVLAQGAAILTADDDDSDTFHTPPESDQSLANVLGFPTPVEQRLATSSPRQMKRLCWLRARPF
eukprot:TRINITY_DN7377_c0_g1_i1.p1 TRINITY_DN7377_c0_g1~~TRINITY_DN7377_c0_g1_i1.p1  ORF type:complete len:309 (-),score=54.63 TRINITY_DN7377_c0_g1_i1:1215-2033(-)